MSDYIAELQAVFAKLHNCEAEYVETVPIVEEFQGKTIWQGDVEVFDIRGHPKATRGYGWGYVANEEGGRRYYTVLQIPPVNSPQNAVRAAIRAEIENARKKTKSR